MKFIQLFLLLAALILVACAPIQPGVTPVGTPTAPDNPGSALAGTSWQLVTLGPEEAATPVLPESTIILEFGADGQAGGNGGCNSYGGPYTVQGDTLTFGEIVSTLMACADQAITQQEQQYLQALPTANRFTVTDNTLIIEYDNGGGVLTFAQAATMATPLPLTPTQVSATATPLPTVTAAAPGGGADDAETTRITFAPGETSAIIQGMLAERATDFYVLRAQEGQVMSVEITSPHNDVLLSVVGEDGTPYKRYQNGPPSWSSTLPATQDYFLHAVSVGPATDYTLRVQVEPLAAGRERIEVASGATSAQRSGLLPSGLGVLDYVLAANAGQTMTVDATSDDVPLSLTMTEPSGMMRIAEVFPTDGGYRIGHQFVLSETGDYLVTLRKDDHTPSTNYTVDFTIQ